MTRIVSALVGVGMAAALALAADPPAPSDKVKQMIGGDKVVKLVQAIESAEAFKAESAGTSPTEKLVAGRAIVGNGKELPKELVSKLIEVLLYDDTYLKGDSKGTTKNAAVAFRGKTKDGGVVEISCCLVKGNVQLLVKDSTGKVLKSGDCRGFRDDKQAPMRYLAAAAFPDDAEIQKFKPKAPPPEPKTEPKTEAKPEPKKGETQARDSVDPIKGIAPFEVVHDGLKFADTPSWHAGSKSLVYTDIVAGKLYRRTEAGKPEILREGASRGRVGPDDAFYGHLDTDLSRWRLESKPEPLVAKLRNSREGFHEGALNDLAVSTKGFVYFTTLKDQDTEAADKKGRLSVVDVAKKTVRVAFDGEKEPTLWNPNGVALSPDEKFLYVAISSYANRKNSTVLRFLILEDGSLDVGKGKEAPFAPLAACDGLATDERGNVWITQSDKIHVYSPEGKALGSLKVPAGSATNLSFGGEDLRTLYVTTRTTLYRTRANIPGFVPAAKTSAK